MLNTNKRSNERLLVQDDSEAEDIREKIRTGRLSFEDAAAMIDSMALAGTMRDVRNELQTQEQIPGQPLGWINRK